MTTEQLKELGEALSILSAKSSVLKERDELRSLMQENLSAEEVGIFAPYPLMLSLLTLLAGSKIAFGCSDEAHSQHVNEN